MRRKTPRVQTDAIGLQLVESTDMEPMDAECPYFVMAIMVCCIGEGGDARILFNSPKIGVMSNYPKSKAPTNPKEISENS